MALDFGAFTGGARAAKKDYWDDVKNSQQSLIRDVAVQDGLQMARDKAYKESAASYLAPLLLEQQRAAASGTPVDETFRRQMQAIQNDPGLANMTPEQQYYVAQGLNASGVTMAQKLKEAGDETRALELNKFMGLNFGPENRANPSDIFKSYNLGPAGWTEDPAAGTWRDAQGKVYNASQASQALLQQGQPGVLGLQVDQAERQRQLQEGVARGTHVQYTDANGAPAIREKTFIEQQIDAQRQGGEVLDAKLADDIAQGRVRPGVPGSWELYLNANPEMSGAVTAYQTRQAVAPQGAAAQPAQSSGFFTPQFNESLGLGPATQAAVDTINQGAVSPAATAVGPATQAAVDTINQGATPTPTPTPTPAPAGREDAAEMFVADANGGSWVPAPAEPPYGARLRKPVFKQNPRVGRNVSTGGSWGFEEFRQPTPSRVLTFGKAATPTKAAVPALNNATLTPAEAMKLLQKEQAAATQQGAQQLDPKQLADANAHQAYNTAIAADQQRTLQDAYRGELMDWAATLQGEPTEDDIIQAQMILAQHPELQTDPELISMLTKIGVL